ncbi:MAG: class I SAM-dependent methyltransferase [Anaerolineae bacterium]
MSDILRLLLISTLIAVLAALGWWLFIASEGVYLGRRIVILLYDLYASRYDNVKGYLREYEQLYLAEPIMDFIAPHTAPLVLDVATGTGRLPLAMARHPDFTGHTIGVDLSRKMLDYATRNIFPYEERATFIWCPAEHLPFPDDTFDVVTCLEALEFTTNPQAVVRELVRVLRPGGLMLISQRINTKLMPGKTWTSKQIQQVLREAGIADAKAQIWQVDYRKVWAWKDGKSQPTGVRPLTEILRCPHCGQIYMAKQGGIWLCENCRREAKVGKDGVIELFPMS